MPKYIYNTIVPKVESAYLKNTGKDVYSDLGEINIKKARILVEAEDEESALRNLKAITDISLWEFYDIRP